MTNAEFKKLKDDLWASADQLRANSGLKSTEYATPILAPNVTPQPVKGCGFSVSFEKEYIIPCMPTVCQPANKTISC